jgi:PIN domain nuclease of toxin-antitoxin system
LLDTHAFLWYAQGSSDVRAACRDAIESPENELLLSVASCWEMAIKISLGKLRLGEGLDALLDRSRRDGRVGVLGIEVSHVSRVATLPMHHRDPFDRLLVAQALCDDLTLVSRDASLDAYGIKRLW